MTDPSVDHALRKSARRILRAKRGRPEHRAERRWLLWTALVLVLAAALAAALLVIGGAWPIRASAG
jgi:hypothetical protein